MQMPLSNPYPARMYRIIMIVRLCRLQLPHANSPPPSHNESYGLSDNGKEGQTEAIQIQERVQRRP